MRENFIVKGGYPVFEDTGIFPEFDLLGIKEVFITDSTSYPRFLNMSGKFISCYSKFAFFTFPDINDGYPILLCCSGLEENPVSDIYSGDNNARFLYFEGLKAKKVFFREKPVYILGYSW